MQTIIIGGASYLGFNLIKRITKTNVITVISEKPKNSTIKNSLENLKVKVVPEIQSLFSEKITKDFSIVYLGGYSCSDHKLTDIDPMVKAYITGVTQALELARKFEIPFYIAGSYWELLDIEHENSKINLYAEIQFAQNRILNFFSDKFAIPITKIYIADTYGPADWRPKLISKILLQSKVGVGTIEMGSPKQIIAPLYIEDTVGDICDIINSSDLNVSSVNYLQLKPDKIFTLGDYVDLIKKTAKIEISINWNTRPQLRSSIYEFPYSKFLYENKKARTNLEDGINSILTKLNEH
jgi:nucleoside-diphosphate-sugar epimerase